MEMERTQLPQDGAMVIVMNIQVPTKGGEFPDHLNDTSLVKTNSGVLEFILNILTQSYTFRF
jgi:hypothetical protein